MIGSVLGDSEFKCSESMSYIHTGRCFVTNMQVSETKLEDLQVFRGEKRV